MAYGNCDDEYDDLVHVHERESEQSRPDTNAKPTKKIAFALSEATL